MVRLKVTREKRQTREGASYGGFHREGKRKEVTWERYRNGGLRGKKKREVQVAG